MEEERAPLEHLVVARTLQEQTDRFRGLEASVRLFKSEKTKVLRTYQILLDESLFPAACQPVVCGPPAKLQIRFFWQNHTNPGEIVCVTRI